MRIVPLDIARFIAASSVVFYHYLLWAETKPIFFLREVAQFGYLGVPFFFIISGYVIALSAQNRSAAQFVFSRCVRLLPALWVAIFFTVIITVFVTGERYTLPQILSNLTAFPNYLGFADIDGVYWTLRVEIKFYCCILLLLLFRVFHKHYVWLSIWISLTALHILTAKPSFMGMFISPEYSSFLITGVIFYLIHENGSSKRNVLLLCISLLMSCHQVYYQSREFIQHPSTLESIIAVLILLTLSSFMYLTSTGRIHLTNRTAYTTIGALTYPLYLIHNTAGKALLPYLSSKVPQAMSIFIMYCLMAYLSWLMHRYIEKPVSALAKKGFDYFYPSSFRSSRPDRKT